MAYDYNKSKQMYQSMTKEQQQQFVNQNKNDANFKQFMSDYMNDINGKNQTNTQSNFNNGQKNLPEMPTEMAVPSGEEQKPLNQTNTQSNFNNGELDQKVETTKDANGYSQTKNGFYTGNSEWEKEQNRKKLEAEKNNQGITKVYNPATGEYEAQPQVSPDLDQSKFQQDPGKITVQEGTAQQTGRPDYQASTDARLNEMKGNLDHYFATSPRMFSDRETFNKVFEYNNRESEAQRQLLDSYRKRKEDMDKASQYTSGESIMNGMNNSEITTDQLNLLKEYNPEAYQKRQELQEEEIKKRIVNDIVPPLLEAISQNMINMMNNLGIQPQEAEDIEGVYNDTMDRTQAWQTMEDANRTVKRIEEVNNQRTAIMNRYAASTGGTVSDALAAARMQKALAPYDTEMQGLQYQYQDYANLFSQKQAAAYQAAQVRQMQASENQRIWNQRVTALGFAADALNWRTPEQKAQLELQKKGIENEMDLLQTSKENDLSLYNKYATSKLENQLQSELTDLSVKDPTQLRANLNNVLSDYYKNYGDIIQRPQSQVIDDVLAYAEEHGVSVAEALRENFIKPLQNKAEYKQKVATDYGMLSKQSIGTINGRSVIMTTNPNGSISYKYIDDASGIISSYTIGDTSYVVLSNGETMTAEEYNKQYGGNIKAYNQVDSRAFTADPISTGYEGKTLYDFLNDPKNKAGNTGGQCAAFVNRYLESIGVGKYYGTEDVKTREKRCNSDTPQVGTIAVFDYNHYTDGKNYGHVAIVTKTYADGSFDVIDSNYDTKNPGKITTRHINAGTASLKGFFDPSQAPSMTTDYSTTKDTKFEWNGNVYDFTKYSGWKDLTDDEWLTVESLLTYQTDPASLPKSGKDNGASNSRVRAAASAIGRDYGYNERKFKEVKTIEDQRYKAAGPGGSSSANSTAMSILKAISDSFSDLDNYDINTVNTWINQYKAETGDPTVGALYTDMRVASSEIAKALKGGASPTTEEINDIKSLLNGNMGEAQAKEVFKHFAKNLYEKNESEALNFYRVTGYKPEPIYTDEAAKWLTNSMGVDLSRYYNYNGGVATGPKDEATRYYDGLQIGNKTYSNSELDDMVDEIFNS